MKKVLLALAVLLALPVVVEASPTRRPGLPDPRNTVIAETQPGAPAVYTEGDQIVRGGVAVVRQRTVVRRAVFAPFRVARVVATPFLRRAVVVDSFAFAVPTFTPAVAVVQPTVVVPTFALSTPIVPTLQVVPAFQVFTPAFQTFGFGTFGTFGFHSGVILRR